MDNLDTIQQEHLELYGKPKTMFRATGLAVTAIIEAYYGIQLPHPIPPHIMAQVDVVKKCIRACSSQRYHEDDYVDEQNYVRLAQQLDNRVIEE